MTIYNTLTEDLDVSANLIPASKRGEIIIVGENIHKGEDILNMIEGSPDKIYLVDNYAYNILIAIGVKNVTTKGLIL